jgi:hypothetical protein
VAADLMSYADAKRCLQQIQPELQQVNPSGARSLEEGLEETLTMHRPSSCGIITSVRIRSGRL